MSRLRSLLELTVATHTVLAAGVWLHSRLTDREAGLWLPLTFVFGLFGLAGYVLDR